MKKIFFLIAFIITSIITNAQGSDCKVSKWSESDSSIGNLEQTNTIRMVDKDTTIILSSTNDGNYKFHLLQGGSNVIYSENIYMKGGVITDFQVYDKVVYFCGRTSSSYGFIKEIPVRELFDGGITTIILNELPSINIVNKLKVYFDNVGGAIKVAAIGTFIEENNGDCFIDYKPGNGNYIFSDPINERFSDILLTNDYIATVGNKISNKKDICIRRYVKTDPLQNYINGKDIVVFPNTSIKYFNGDHKAEALDSNNIAIANDFVQNISQDTIHTTIRDSIRICHTITIRDTITINHPVRFCDTISIRDTITMDTIIRFCDTIFVGDSLLRRDTITNNNIYYPNLLIDTIICHDSIFHNNYIFYRDSIICYDSNFHYDSIVYRDSIVCYDSIFYRDSISINNNYHSSNMIFKFNLQNMSFIFGSRLGYTLIKPKIKDLEYNPYNNTLILLKDFNDQEYNYNDQVVTYINMTNFPTFPYQVDYIQVGDNGENKFGGLLLYNEKYYICAGNTLNDANLIYYSKYIPTNTQNANCYYLWNDTVNYMNYDTIIDLKKLNPVYKETDIYKIEKKLMKLNKFSSCFDGEKQPDPPFKSDVRINQNFNETTLYPNPATTYTEIISNNKIIILEIYNNLGQKIESKEINGNSIIINTSNYSKGLYVARLITIDGIVNKKFIIK